MRKINDFKNNALKVKRVQKTFENLNSFLDNAENAKNDANISRTYILLGFCCFLLFLFFFQKFIKN
jgi:3-methyladenine DNA glycosylase Tag